ncbi:MAG: PAS domain S-box protein [Pirellulales bacterium]|nr:PAS domain S-box protein [Pirellulales bacterium]
MSGAHKSALRYDGEELQALYDGSSEGIIIASLDGKRFHRVNRAMCQMLGYAEEELLSLSVREIHPADCLPRVLEEFRAMARREVKHARDIPCLRKDGGVIYADITTAHIERDGQACMLGFFYDITERKRTIELLRASDNRFRAIAENVADVIWTVDFPAHYFKRRWGKASPAELADAVAEQWRFSYVSPAAERIFGYTREESLQLSLGGLVAAEDLPRVREALIEVFSWGASKPADSYRKRFLEVRCRAKDGSLRWCEIVSTYLRDEDGVPIGLQGITRDVSERRRAERALRESEAALRLLFENTPDLLVLLDRDLNIKFVNRAQSGLSREEHVGKFILDFSLPENRDACRLALEEAFATGRSQTVEAKDVFGVWWSCRVVPIAGEGGVENVLAIATDVTQERTAAEAVKKEQRLLRRLLEIHERERRLVSCEIHDGFAQQLTGALFRLQSFRETLARNPAEAWMSFDSAADLLARAIDETRRLISGLRPPVLDEMGIVDAVQYIIYEHRKEGGPEIEFAHDLSRRHLGPSLENAVFRIIQESLRNACRHSRSEKIRVALFERADHVHVEVRDWGVGFDCDAVEEDRFGLQGIRERVRLLEGSVTIESAPDEGTRLSVRLPLLGGDEGA